MKTFLINYTLKKSSYMQDDSKEENKSILVEAESEDKAVRTLEKYWEDKSDSYGDSYDVWGYDVVPTISQSEILD